MRGEKPARCLKVTWCCCKKLNLKVTPAAEYSSNVDYCSLKRKYTVADICSYAMQHIEL